MDNLSRQHQRAAGVAVAGIVFGVLSQASLIGGSVRPPLQDARQACARPPLQDRSAGLRISKSPATLQDFARS